MPDEKNSVTVIISEETAKRNREFAQALQKIVNNWPQEIACQKVYDLIDTAQGQKWLLDNKVDLHKLAAAALFNTTYDVVTPQQRSDAKRRGFIRMYSSPERIRMSYSTIRMNYITRAFVRSRPDWTFLFGDNLEEQGMGGQAYAMRGEPNALGIPTKKAPSNADGSFFTDDYYGTNCDAIDKAFSKLPKAPAVIVIPAAGLGTGLAELDKRAPRTFEYLSMKLKNLGGQMKLVTPCDTCMDGRHDVCEKPSEPIETENEGGLAFVRLCCCAS